MNRKVLVFAMASDQKEAIRAIGEKMGYTVVTVLPREYHQKLGYLAGIVGFKKVAGGYKGMDFPQEMLILSGMDPAAVDLFLQEYRKTGLPKIDRKATITPTNAFWTPTELFEELGREHREMHRS